MNAELKELPKEDTDQKGRRKKLNNNSWLHFILAPLSLAWMVPLIMVVGLSLMPTNNPKTVFFGMFPEAPSFSNYVLVFEQNPILHHLVNSAIIAIPSVLIVVFVGAMAAFALAKLKIPLKALFFGILILGLVLPMSGIVVAVFKILQAMSLYNNLLGLVLVYSALGLPFAVIIIRTAFMAVPHETYEAAVVDGASMWTIFWKIYMPLATPAISVVVIWQLMMSWNDFLLPLVSISDNNLKPLTLIPMAYRGIFLSQPGALFAVLVLISIPVIIVFVALQKYLVNGLAGAIK